MHGFQACPQFEETQRYENKCVEKVVAEGMQEKAREFVKNGGEVYSKV
jgi:hypothetical protein